MTLFRLKGKSDTAVLERIQSSFYPGHFLGNQLFTLSGLSRASLEFAHLVYMHLGVLWGRPMEYEMSGSLLPADGSLHNQKENCVCNINNIYCFWYNI